MAVSADPIIAAIDARIAALQELRTRCVELLGPIASLPVATAGTTHHERPVKRMKSEPGRPTKAPKEPQQRILAALKQRGGPISPGELAAALDLSGPLLRYQLRPLVKAGQVTLTGTTSSRRIALA